MNLLKISLLTTAIFLSADNTPAQWSQMPSSPDGLFRDIVDENGILYAAHAGIGVYKSEDSSQTWDVINDGLNSGQARAVNQLLVNNDTMFAATDDGIYKTTNGDNWIRKSAGIFVGNGALYAFTQSIFEHNGNLFTGAWTGIYRSTNGGENWIATNISGEGIMARNFIYHNGILFAARESINFPNGYKSTDNGVTWQPLTSISMPTITFLSEPPNLWAGTIRGVWLSTNDGASWVHRSSGLAPDPYNTSIIRVNGRLVSSIKFGGSGIYRSTDEGMLWENFGDGLVFLNTIDKLILYGGYIIAATDDGLWQRDSTDVMSDVEMPGDNLPWSIALQQNYPNPFNPATTIEYSVPYTSHVSLRVYNILGNEIKSLVDEVKLSGNYKIGFESENLSSSLYFYKIE